MRRAHASAQLKVGTVGIKVSIMPPDIVLPDAIRVRKEEEIKEALAAAEQKMSLAKEEKEEAVPKKPKKQKRPLRKKEKVEKAEKSNETKGD